MWHHPWWEGHRGGLGLPSDAALCSQAYHSWFTLISCSLVTQCHPRHYRCHLPISFSREQNLLRAEPVTQCCTGTDLFSFPSRLCTSVSSCVSRDVILVAWKQLQERGVRREREEGSTLWNLANQDLCKCCRGRLSLCPPLSAESWFLNSYWHTTWLCPFYFVTLAAKHCIDLEGAW